jgi:hypothetical protein
MLIVFLVVDTLSEIAVYETWIKKIKDIKKDKRELSTSEFFQWQKDVTVLGITMSSDALSADLLDYLSSAVELGIATAELYMALTSNCKPVPAI